MKIGIFTFHCAINYGAVLQAYALQEYLKTLGHEVFIIDYRPSYLIYPYRIFRWNEYPNRFIPFIKWFIRELFVIPIRWKRKVAFDKFIRKYLNICKLDINDASNDFDAFVFGSDQIWNKQITEGFDDMFFGDFPAAKGKNKVAYAASLGDLNNFMEYDINYIKLKLQSFALIGVREQSVSSVFKELDIPTIHVLDPVLLAGPTPFQKFNKQKYNSRPYLLLFTLGRDEFVITIAHRIAQFKSLEVVEVVSSKESLCKSIFQTLSPSDFVSTIFNASYIVTSSFHGTVFSLMYSKDLTVVQPLNAHNDRIQSLLESVGLESRLAYENDEYLDYSAIEYEAVQKKIKEMKSLSEGLWQDLMRKNYGLL